MYSKPFRLGLLALGVLLSLAAGYRAVADEAALNRERQDAAAADAAVVKTTELLLDIRASLHAYVAPGQTLSFWAKRTQENINTLRQSLLALDPVMSPIGRPMSQSLDGVDQLTAAESRARTHASRGEMQLAGDVIFTEVRDILAGAREQVDAAHIELKRRNELDESSIRSEQITWAGAAFAIWMVIALLFFPTESRPSVKNPAAWRHELKETLAKPLHTPAAPAPAAPPAPVVAPVPLPPSVQVSSVREVSEICADLSALTDPGALHGTLGRVNALLNATGSIVWIASNDGNSLSPVATNGFDPTLVARIGRISRDSANLTAAAFRDNGPKVSLPTPTTPAALAIALCGPTGPAGVLSIELKPGHSVDEARVALASIIAAQLATLTMPISMAEPEIGNPAETAEAKRAAL